MSLYNKVSTFLEAERLNMLGVGDLLDLVQKSDRNAPSQLLLLSDRCERVESSFIFSLPFHMNVISAAARGRLKETAHSIILHNLLHHPVVLRSFLRNVADIDDDTFCVKDIEYPDKNRIDLSLRSKQKFLIIENKVNSAEEQFGQVYRYYAFARETHDEENILILYLNPCTNEPPSLYSRSRNGNGGEDDYDTIRKDKITVKNYEHDILGWLYKLSDKSTLEFSNEPYLKSAIHQYIDYLEEYFQTKDKYKPLHSMIEKEIKECFGLNDIQSRDSQIELLLDKKSSLERLTSELDRVLNKLMREQAAELFEQQVNVLNSKFNGKVNFRLFNLKDPEIGFDIEFENQLLHVTIIYYNDNKYYWRVICTPGLDDCLKKHIDQMISPIMGNVKWGSKGQWDVYNSTSKENCILRLSQLAGIFVKAPGFKVCE